MASSCTDSGLTRPGVAWCLPLLAPRLAPRDLDLLEAECLRAIPLPASQAPPRVACKVVSRALFPVLVLARRHTSPRPSMPSMSCGATGGRYAFTTMRTGGGQAIAAIFEPICPGCVSDATHSFRLW
jgi:hypothetical protein